jgi:hypothetical protein
MAGRFLSVVLVLASAGSALAQSNPPLAATPATGTGTAPATVVPAPDFAFVPPAPSGARSLIWGGAEYLLWWVEGQRVPALVTTSAPGAAPSEAGVIGLPETSALFGDSVLHGTARSGVRLTIGTWLDSCRTCGVGGEFFILFSQGEEFAARSSGLPILARPFFNTVNQAQDSQLVAYPALASGAVSASSESQLLGASAFFRHVLTSDCDCTVEGLWGYRYLNLNERIIVDQESVVGPFPPDPLNPPVSFLIHDSFRAQTQFHGGDVGLAAYAMRGRFVLSALARLGVGANVRDLRLEGSTGISAPGALPNNFNGGILTVGRTGETSDCVFALVPEVRLGLGYRVTDCIQLTVGYNSMWWTNVARAGDQVDLAVNPNFFPPPVAPFVNRPPAIRDTTVWIQGLSFGLLFNY